MRQNKGTRAKGLPPRVQLQTKDASTGSYPTIQRTPSDNRTGSYRTYFDDTKVVSFVSTGSVVYPSGLPSGSVHLLNDQGVVDTELDSDIIAEGIVRKGIGDSFVKFTPGQEIQPFVDNNHPAVDGLSMSSSNNARLFYATGSAINIVGEGFNQPLWSKTKFEIDLTPATSHSFFIQNTLSTSRNCPMAYWNKDSRRYEGIGLGKEFGVYTGSTESTLTRLFDDQCIGFVGGTDNGDGYTARDLAVGAVQSNFGFPYHPKFHATSSNLVNMSSYIDSPFLLEKIVLEFSGTFRYNNTYHGNVSRISLCTFFIMNQKKPFGIAEGDIQKIKWGIGGNPQTLTTGSFIPTTYNGNYVDTIRDIVTWGQILGSYDVSPSSKVTRELFFKELVISGTNWNQHVILSMSMKNPLPSDGLMEINWTVDSGFNSYYFLGKNENSSRNGLSFPTGRDWLGPLEKGQITTTDTLVPGMPLILLDRYFKTNPYVLFPTDQLIFGWQLPLATYWNSDGSNEQYQGRGPELTFAPTPSKITFYGSKIEQGMESHDTLNQLLTSQTIHEVIG